MLTYFVTYFAKNAVSRRELRFFMLGILNIKKSNVRLGLKGFLFLVFSASKGIKLIFEDPQLKIQVVFETFNISSSKIKFATRLIII